jgi:lactate racemase
LSDDRDESGARADGAILRLPELLWYGGGHTEIRLPDDWQVEVHHLRGADRPAVTSDQVAAAVAHPIGTAPLRDLARGRRKAVILFDDMTRPTRADQIAPVVVEALLDGGIAPDRISFVCALGAHGALTQVDLRKKLGAAIVERFRVYNHNCYEHCVFVGTTTRGTPVRINREVMAADLRIGIGGVIAHPNVGFSGGGKIVVPGVAGIETIQHYHLAVPRTAPAEVGYGRYDANPMRQDSEEAARMAGLDFKVDVVFNEEAVASAVFAGDFVPVHRHAVALARKAYALPRGRPQNDLAIVNALAKPNEIVVAYMVGVQALAPRREGTVVILANAPEGQAVHYLLGRFGEGYGGARYPAGRVAEGIRLVVQAPHFDRTFGDWFANPEAITWTRNWAGTLEVLRRVHGPGSRVAVVPDGTMGYYPP